MEDQEREKYCPCCGRHCDLSEPHCQYGKEYLRTGIVTEKRHEEKRHESDEEIYHERSRRREGHRNKGADSTELRRHHGCHGGECECADEQDINGRLVANIRNLGHTLRFLFGGKGGQKRILSMLYETGSMTQRSLTERIGIQSGSASEVIGKLEHAGLIQRAASEKDRRTTDVQLTELGRELGMKAVKERKGRREEMFSCLTEKEKEQLLSLTEKLNADWNCRYSEERSKKFEEFHR